MNDIIASGLHFNIAELLQGDGLALRSFCTCGSRELWSLWTSTKEQWSRHCESRYSGANVFPEGALHNSCSDYHAKLISKLVKKHIFADVRVRLLVSPTRALLKVFSATCTIRASVQLLMLTCLSWSMELQLLSVRVHFPSAL